MLFHVTMTHTEDNCPAYQPEKMAEFIAVGENLDGLAKELDIQVHNLFWGAPEHVAYALIEANSLGAIARFVFSFPFKQDFKVTPVQNLDAVIATSKAILAQKKAE